MFKKFIHVQTVDAFPAELEYAHENYSDLPKVIHYHGTVKLHGTNVGIVVAPDGSLTAQSRNRDITPEDDQLGFARFLSGFTAADLFEEPLTSDKPFVIFGEWVGKGIMKGTACSTIPDKRFVAFSLYGYKESERFFPAPKMKAPFDNVAAVDLRLHINSDGSNYSEQLAAAMELTAQIDKECPWAKARGFEGPGEGVVWRPNNLHSSFADRLWLKTKGQAHKVKTKVARPAEDVAAEQKAVAELYEKTDGPTRVSQGIDYLKEMGHEVNMKSIGTFIQWFNKDFARECAAQIAETSKSSGMADKALRKAVGSLAVQEYRASLLLEEG